MRTSSAVDVAPISDLDHGHRLGCIGDLVAPTLRELAWA
jgi:hypothetical protein